jgi:hypothetical protein
MYTDNVWIQSQDKAIKAGRLLGEVLEKRVQGQRPVILVSAVSRSLHTFLADIFAFMIDRSESRSFDGVPRFTLPELSIKRCRPPRDRRICLPHLVALRSDRLRMGQVSPSCGQAVRERLVRKGFRLGIRR